MDQAAYFPTIRQLAQYEIWCNTKALDAAATLTHEELFRPFPFGLKTIHHTFFHTLGVFGYWSGFIKPEITDSWRWDYDPDCTIDELRQRNQSLSKAFLDAIDESHAAGLLDQDRRLVQVFHLVTHSTHHRTQFISMLRLLGKDPPFEAGDFAGWQHDQPT